MSGIVPLVLQVRLAAIRCQLQHRIMLEASSCRQSSGGACALELPSRRPLAAEGLWRHDAQQAVPSVVPACM